MKSKELYKIVQETIVNGVVIKIMGAFNSQSSPEIKHLLLEIAQEGNLLLELSGVTVLTSAGVGALLETADMASRKSSVFVIVNPSPRVNQVINLTGFNEMFQFAKNIAEAQKIISQ